MNPITHLLASWVIANIPKGLSRRDMLLITAAGVVPDADGLGAVVEMATINTSNPLLWFTEYHHALHCGTFCIAVCCVTAAWAKRKAITTALAALAFHIHILCDIIGARGPDGYDWPIPYLLPFSRDWKLTWAGQWELNAWPNIAITLLLLLITFRLAWSRGRSVVGLVSPRADAVFVETIRKRFPRKGEQG
jgi:inner membrane protein